MPNYKLSKKAEIDLRNIWKYIADNWSLKQGNDYLNLIFEKINILSENPSQGKIYSSVRKDYLGSSVKSHIVFYKQKDNSGIEIIRILHQRMDLKTRLKD